MRSILKKFIGKKMQIPPAYSALKFKGRPSYDFARKGKRINLKPRMVSIYDIGLISINDDLLTIKVKCGSGTYIRSLAYEIGKLVECGASIKGLKRTKIGAFDIKNSTYVNKLIGGKIKGSSFESSPYIISIERVLEENPSLYIKDKYRKNILNGHPVRSEMVKPEGIAAKGILKKGTFVKIKDRSSNFLGVHRILSEDAASDIGKKGSILTGSILVFES